MIFLYTILLFLLGMIKLLVSMRAPRFGAQVHPHRGCRRCHAASAPTSSRATATRADPVRQRQADANAGPS